MNKMQRLYKWAFWSCFGGVAMVACFVILPLNVFRAVTSVPSASTSRLVVFVAFCGAVLTLVALVVAWLVPLYANVMDRKERVKRLVQICRCGRWVMFYANWPLLLWRKAIKPVGLYIGGATAVALLALGLFFSSLTKASREEDKEDSWLDKFYG